MDRSQPLVRLAAPGDADEIGALHVRSWQVAYDGIVPAAVLDGLSPERRATFWRDVITRHAADAATGRTLVIDEDGAVAGFAETGPARDDDLPDGSGELNAIYLAPEAWSRGLGRRLFEHAVDDLVGSGRDPVVLWVLAANQRARRFYERCGWSEDGTARELDFDGTPVTEVRYRRAMGARDP